MMWWNHSWGFGWGWIPIMAVAVVVCAAMMARMMGHGGSGFMRQRGNRDEDAPSAFWPGGWPAVRSTWPSSSASAMHCGAPATQQRTRQSPAAPSGARHLPDQAALARAA